MIEALATCPRCAGDLSAWSCAACGVTYPVIGGVPCLLPDFASWRRKRAAEIAVLDAQFEHSLAVFAQASRRPGQLPRTLTRIERQSALTTRMQTEILDALGPIGAPVEANVDDFRPLESVHLLHRDWGWSESEENARALAHVERMREGPSKRILVLGAGAGRLAYDVHRATGAELTVALDIDPVVTLLAHRVTRGEEIPFVEGNSAALDADLLDAPRVLRAPEGPAPGLQFAFGDGLAPPFRPHAFDTVLTPWFIDLVPPDLRDFFGVLDRMLAPGGQWVNYGPLLYPPSRSVSCRFTLDEIGDLATLAGFTIEDQARERVPYSVSPLAGRGRLETCAVFRARKGTRREVPGSPPAWLVLPYLPVPAFDVSSVSGSSDAFLLVAGFVDGKRSIDDITRAVIERSGTSAPGVKDTVRYCLAELHPLAR